MRYVSIFSGIEAASVAWEGLGWEPVAFSEIDPFCCEVLAQRFPDVPNLGDITKIDWNEVRELGTVDLVVGGSPCQSFSVAGRREGLDGESRLMYEYIRCVQDLRPTWVLWENVPGVFSIDNGRAFGTLISALQDLGYSVAWRVLDAQFFGVAQRRRRVYVVGHLGGGGHPAAVLFECESVPGNTQASRDKREAITRQAEDRLGEAICIQGSMINRQDKNGPSGQGLNEDVSFTLSCVDHHAVYSRTERPKSKGDASVYRETGLANTLNRFDIGDKRSNELVCEPIRFKYRQELVRRLTPLECERLQGFPDGWTDIPYKGKPAPDSARYKALGNSFAVPVVKWIGERIQMVEEIKEERKGNTYLGRAR